MKSSALRVRELAAWGFDESPYRPACDGVAAPDGAVAADCLVAVESEVLAALFAEQALRADLRAEMDGLAWSVGVVDLRGLIAFQRRVVFDPEAVRGVECGAEDWAGLMAVAFGPPVPPVYRTKSKMASEVILESENPNLQVRPASDGLLEVHGGSPFFEVAEFRGRWFLRDGYHRAYALLQAGIVRVPAVVVRAKTLQELGPVGEWFFPEEILFGPRPPRVTDFLDDALTIEYTRPRMLKTIRITVEESFAPATTEGDER